METRILIVDDEEPVRLLLHRILSAQGYLCSMAGDTAEAKECLNEQPFDLVLCDIRLPGESGLDLTRSILNDHPETAAIMISGMDDPRLAMESLNMGAYGYITKPLNPFELLVHVSNALLRKRLEIENRRYRSGLEQLVLERTKDLEETISNLEKTRAELHESEAKFRSLFEHSLDAVYMTSKSGRILEMNRAGLDLFGLTQEEVKSIPVLALYQDPGERARFISSIERDSFVRDYPLRMKRKDGTPIHALISATVRKDIDGRIIGYQGIVRDVTEQRRMEDDLKRAHQDNEHLIAAISSILIWISETGEIRKWNAVAEKTFGLPSGEVLGRPLASCPIPWDWKRVEKGIQECRERNGPVRIEDFAFTRTDGKQGIMGMTVNPLRNSNGELLGMLLIASDITKRKLLESQLAPAQKLESIGQLAAGIAHEINTPTQYIGDNIRFLDDAFHDLHRLLQKYQAILCSQEGKGLLQDSRVQEIDALAREIDLDYLLEEIPKAIRQSLDGVDRVATIVRAMKEFSHPGSKEKTAVDINKAIENTITVSRNEWKYIAEMVTDFDPSLPAVKCFPGELNQAILNILVNAAHAISEVVGDGSNGKGRITVTTRHQGPWAEIRISDTGPGIPERIRPRIFDPFFTTKDVGKGTGQGLTICHSVIVEQHGGTIELETEMGKGTTFLLRIPIEDHGN